MSDGAAVLVTAYLSLGSNIEPEKNLRLACAGLRATYGELTLSPVYQTPAVGFDGDDFLNMVVGFQTTQTVAAIKEVLEDLHRKAQRVRLPDRFSSRTLDADVLLYCKLVDPLQQLPHPDMEKYPFVMGPLAEIAADLRHPVSGERLQKLWQNFVRQDAEMIRISIDLDS